MTANQEYLRLLVGQFNTLSDEENDRVVKIDPNDEGAVKAAIAEFIAPFFNVLADESQQRIKHSLQYFLNTGTADFYDIIYDQPDSYFPVPSDPKRFFIWLWEVLFPGECYLLSDLKGWKEEVTRINVGLRIRR